VTKRRAVAAVAVLAVVVPGAGLIAFAHRTHQAAERVVARATALDAKKPERASHAPVPGGLDEFLEPLLRAPVTPEPACTTSADSAECHAAWERDRGWALDVLKASRAERWAPVSGLHDVLLFGDVEGTRLLIYAARLGALEVGQLQPDAALEVCLDGLALARDHALGGGMMSASIGADLQQLFAAPCTAQLAAASPEQRERARLALEGIRKSWPHTGAWVPYQMVLGLTGCCRSGFSVSQLSRLPGWARAPRRVEPDLVDRLMVAHALPALVKMYERLEQAAALEPVRRGREVAAIEAAEREASNPLRNLATVDWEQFFTREDQRREELEQLVAAARRP
jgi:hypothetical protein